KICYVHRRISKQTVLNCKNIFKKSKYKILNYLVKNDANKYKIKLIALKYIIYKKKREGKKVKIKINMRASWLKYSHNFNTRSLQTKIYEKKIDLRSDTVTLPTAAMRQAMLESKVGDDVYGEDPTVNSLQERMSHLFLGNKFTGKNALFVPTGTMGNLISCISHCSNTFDSEMILGDESHIHFYEQGGIASVGRIHSRVIQNNKTDGTLSIKDIEKCVRPMHLKNVHFPITKLICLENTQNRCGGAVLPLSYLQELRQWVNAYNDEYKSDIKIHLDGARIFNALVEYGNDYLTYPYKIMDYVDSISVCFSKGLGAPIGSMVISPCDEFMQRCLRLRKVLGGGMRQVGVIASCAHVSLDEVVPKLKQDHINALLLADKITKLQISGLQIEKMPQTNIVNFVTEEQKLQMTDEQVVLALKQANVLINCMSKNKFRMVLYHQISTKDVLDVVDRLQSIFSNKKKQT
ncbi:hypothetical protein RFI_30498, partial [Reticulomyxa filosa]